MDEKLTVFVNRRRKLITRDELEKCSKEVSVNTSYGVAHVHNVVSPSIQELIDRILQLETHNQQLKNVLKKEIGGANTYDNNQKKFDFSK